jgi:predicted MarR family transcription regulator
MSAQIRISVTNCLLVDVVVTDRSIGEPSDLRELARALRLVAGAIERSRKKKALKEVAA